MPLPRHFGLAGRWAASALVTLVFWTLGLGLSLLLAVQVYVACSNQLEVPVFVVRALEERLAAAGMHASFGRTRFDPSGRVLIEDLRVTLPGSEEPLVTATAVYARLDLWALLRERFEPVELRLTGASLRVPAMFSPSGQADEIVRDLNADLLPHGAELEITSLNFRVGELAVSARGLVHLGGLQVGRPTRLPFTQLFAQSYGTVTKLFAGAISHLGVLDHPILQIELAPSESHGALVTATLVASGLHLAAPVDLQAGAVRLTSSFPLLNSTEPIDVEARATRLSLSRLATEARGVRARLQASRPPGMLTVRDLKSLDVFAAEIVTQGVVIRTPSAVLTAGPWPKVHAEIHSRPLDAPLAVRADLDFSAQTAAVQVEGELAPGLVDVIGARMHHDLRLFVSPGAPIAFSGSADFGPGWTKFRRAGGRFLARDLDTCFASPKVATRPRLRIDEVRGQVEFDGRRLFASELFTRFGDNFARGSYEMDVPTLRYRFLLNGRLRPLDIRAWFPTQPWWENLFSNFQFPGLPPFANMEWRGQWPTDHETRLFISIDAPAMAINGVPYDRVYSRLFIRPHFDDALEFSITHGAEAATGTFARWYDPNGPPPKPGGPLGMTRRVDLDVVSTLAISPFPKMWPKDSPPPPEILTLFAFDRPPSVKLSGRFDWPGARGDVHKVLHLEVRTDSGFQFHAFPLDRTAFTADVKDDAIMVEPMTLGFAGGSVTGRVQISGTGPGGKIALTAKLRDASLPRAIELVQGYSAKGPSAKPVIAGEFLKNMTGVRVDLSVAAEGAYADPLSYRGNGSALVQGPELTKVRLLGLLTPLLPFMELRFTKAEADFVIAGSQVNFPDITVTGANSRIDAHGTYAVEHHALDFYARVYPLRENRSFPGQLASVVLTIPSALSQVRLTGSPDNPKWTLLASPFNILRSLISPGNRQAPSPAIAPPSPLAHPAIVPPPASPSPVPGTT